MKGLEHKAKYAKPGRVIPETPEHPARELIIPPCRVFYLHDKINLYVLSIMRSERQFTMDHLEN